MKFHRPTVLSVFFAFVAFTVSGCVQLHPAKQVPVKDGRDAMFWQDEALALIKKYQLNPLRASRVLAYSHKGMYEARNEARGQANAEPCVAVAVDYVASRTLDYFFPLETPGRLAAKAELRKAVAGDCSLAISAASAVFVRIRSAAEQDGAFPPRKLRANPAPLVGSWKATPPVYIIHPAEPFAGDWKTFFISRPAALRIPPPLDPQSPAYRAATVEVLEVTRRLSPLERQAAEFWHLDAGSATPPGVWNLKLRELLSQDANRNNNVNTDKNVDTLRLFAIFNMAMYDAMVACWHYKYAFWTERPITASERLDLGAWSPPLVTPPFPGYPSGHATVSGAAAEVIAGYLPLHAATAHNWASEAAMSRLWGGIHFRFDNDEGLALGKQVGAAAIAKMAPR